MKLLLALSFICSLTLGGLAFADAPETNNSSFSSFFRIGNILCYKDATNTQGQALEIAPNIPDFTFEVTIRDASGQTGMSTVAPHTSTPVEFNGTKVQPTAGNTWADVWGAEDPCAMLDISWE
jgi:hypothetical protein